MPGTFLRINVIIKPTIKIIHSNMTIAISGCNPSAQRLFHIHISFAIKKSDIRYIPKEQLPSTDIVVASLPSIFN